MNAWKVILSTLVIFIAGALTGGLLVSQGVRLKQGRIKPPTAQSTVNPWQLRNKELLRRMDRELNLTPDQHEKIERLLAASQNRLNKELQSVRGQIREELNPEQRKKFGGFPKQRAGPEKRRSLGNSFPPSATNAPPANTNNAPENL